MCDHCLQNSAPLNFVLLTFQDHLKWNKRICFFDCLTVRLPNNSSQILHTALSLHTLFFSSQPSLKYCLSCDGKYPPPPKLYSLLFILHLYFVQKGSFKLSSTHFFLQNYQSNKTKLLQSHICSCRIMYFLQIFSLLIIRQTCLHYSITSNFL